VTFWRKQNDSAPRRRGGIHFLAAVAEGIKICVKRGGLRAGVVIAESKAVSLPVSACRFRGSSRLYQTAKDMKP
jgi:hypothetical protein